MRGAAGRGRWRWDRRQGGPRHMAGRVCSHQLPAPCRLLVQAAGAHLSSVCADVILDI